MLKAFFFAFVGFGLALAVMSDRTDRFVSGNDAAKCDIVTKSYMERLTDN